MKLHCDAVKARLLLSMIPDVDGSVPNPESARNPAAPMRVDPPGFNRRTRRCLSLDKYRRRDDHDRKGRASPG
jgi:hypothetical protein